MLDTRLRSLRRLEEMELRKEHEELTKEKADVEKLLGRRKAAVEDDHLADPRAEEEIPGRRRRSASAARRSRGAAERPISISPKR